MPLNNHSTSTTHRNKNKFGQNIFFHEGGVLTRQQLTDQLRRKALHGGEEEDHCGCIMTRSKCYSHQEKRSKHDTTHQPNNFVQASSSSSSSLSSSSSSSWSSSITNNITGDMKPLLSTSSPKSQWMSVGDGRGVVVSDQSHELKQTRMTYHQLTTVNKKKKNLRSLFNRYSRSSPLTVRCEEDVVVKDKKAKKLNKYSITYDFIDSADSVCDHLVKAGENTPKLMITLENCFYRHSTLDESAFNQYLINETYLKCVAEEDELCKFWDNEITNRPKNLVSYVNYLSFNIAANTTTSTTTTTTTTANTSIIQLLLKRQQGNHAPAAAATVQPTPPHPRPPHVICQHIGFVHHSNKKCSIGKFKTDNGGNVCDSMYHPKNKEESLKIFLRNCASISTKQEKEEEEKEEEEDDDVISYLVNPRIGCFNSTTPCQMCKSGAQLLCSNNPVYIKPSLFIKEYQNLLKKSDLTEINSQILFMKALSGKAVYSDASNPFYEKAVSYVKNQWEKSVAQTRALYFLDDPDRYFVVKKLVIDTRCGIFINMNTGEVVTKEVVGQNHRADFTNTVESAEDWENWIPYEVYVNMLLTCLPLRISPRLLDIHYLPKKIITCRQSGKHKIRKPTIFMAMELPDVNLDLQSYIDMLDHVSGQNNLLFGNVVEQFTHFFIRLLDTTTTNANLVTVNNSMIKMVEGIFILQNIFGIFHNDIKINNFIVGHFVDKNPDMLLIDFGAACPVENKNYDFKNSAPEIGEKSTRLYAYQPTTMFSCPESFFGDKSVLSESTTVYGLIRVFYSLLTSFDVFNNFVWSKKINGLAAGEGKEFVRKKLEGKKGIALIHSLPKKGDERICNNKVVICTIKFINSVLLRNMAVSPENRISLSELLIQLTKHQENLKKITTTASSTTSHYFRDNTKGSNIQECRLFDFYSELGKPLLKTYPDYLSQETWDSLTKEYE